MATVDLLVERAAQLASTLRSRQTAQDLPEKRPGFGVPIDVVVATESDLEQLSDHFSRVFYPAARDGIELYAA